MSCNIMAVGIDIHNIRWPYTACQCYVKSLAREQIIPRKVPEI